MNVSSIMTRTVTTIEAGKPLVEAAAVMKEGGFRHLPVVKGTNVVGILSDRDVALGGVFMGKESQKLGHFRTERHLTVTHVMSPCPVIVRPSDSITMAVKHAVDLRLGAFPVIEQGELVGILTVTDLLRAFYDALDDGRVSFGK